MGEALYGPDGYYTGRVRLGGQAADFFTSPELHPAFGALLGRLAAHVWEHLGRPGSFEIVEHGPGTGALCRDLLTWASHAQPSFGAVLRYRLAERSPALCQVQRQTLATAGCLDGRVSWLDLADDEAAVSGRAITGLILANELIDAFPVHVVVMRDGRLLERYVALDQSGRLVWVEDAPSTPELAAYFQRLGFWPGEGCTAEVNLAGITWMERTAATLRRGAVLVLDYGYPAPDLYAPSRKHGTLLTYRAHTLGSNPLVYIGEQDITAHVDFTSLARAGERHYQRDLERAQIDAAAHQANRRALQALVDPDGLGRVQALLQTRGLAAFDPFSQATNDEGESDWLPLLQPDQMRLPGPLEIEGFVDFEGQWQELFGTADGDDSRVE
jgi:SAM-dependent MidA family methyltransferase